MWEVGSESDCIVVMSGISGLDNVACVVYPIFSRRVKLPATRGANPISLRERVVHVETTHPSSSPNLPLLVVGGDPELIDKPNRKWFQYVVNCHPRLTTAPGLHRKRVHNRFFCFNVRIWYSTYQWVTVQSGTLRLYALQYHFRTMCLHCLLVDIGTAYYFSM